jgi:NAD(P)-dependent dehydrogenase (short-subunit alcohol dehydrogenase family)
MPDDRVRGCVCDVSREDDVDRAYDEAIGFTGALDAVFVNAGIDGKGDAAVDLPVDFFRRVLDVNLVGAFLSARAAARRMGDGGATTTPRRRARSCSGGRSPSSWLPAGSG